MDKIIHRLSRVIRSVICGTEAQRGFIPHVLHDLIELETRPMCLTEIAYDWCSVICENRRTLWDWEGLLLTSLEIGFRHLDIQDTRTAPTLTHTEHHPEMVDVVFGSQNSETVEANECVSETILSAVKELRSDKGERLQLYMSSPSHVVIHCPNKETYAILREPRNVLFSTETIADLLHAWTIGYSLQVPPDTCTERLICLHSLVPFSPRLRRLVIRSVELIGYEGFEGVEMERLVELLDDLHVTTEDTDDDSEWLWLLLEALRTSEGIERLSHWYWELLVELALFWSQPLTNDFTYNPQVITFLTEAQEWTKLEFWMGTVCILWPLEADRITEGNLILPLFRQRPGAFEKLKQRMEQWSRVRRENIPESFQRVYKQAQEVAQRDTP